MRRFVLGSLGFGLSLLGAALVAPPRAARAAVFDGHWSVLIVTESGTCDRGYRYGVRVADGRVAYDGDAAFTIDGIVAANGAVKVSIVRGGQSANGTGRLAADAGTGTWHGHGPGGDCAGTWQAERH